MRYDPHEDALIVHQEQAVAAFAAWARQRGEAFLGREALFMALEQTPVCRALRVPKRVGGGVAKCIVFDAAALEEQYAIPAETWATPDDARRAEQENPAIL